MDTEKPPQATHLADYRPPDYLVSSTDLTFEIGDGETRVHNHMEISRRGGKVPLTLNGEDLELESVAVGDSVRTRSKLVS